MATRRQIAFIKDWYVYEAESLALAPGLNSTDTINIEADADFYLIKLEQFSDIAAAAQTDATRVLPLVSVQLVDTGSGRQLLNGNIPIPSIFGDARLPYILPLPRVFKGNSILRVDFTSFDAAATYNVRLAFSGFKDFGLVYTQSGRPFGNAGYAPIRRRGR